MEESKWSVAMRERLVEALSGADYDQGFSFAELGRIIGLTEGESGTLNGRWLIGRAANASKSRLLKQHNRVLVSVRGRGYRVARPNESAGIAMGYRDGADRRISKAMAVLNHTDERELTQAERSRHHATKVLITDLQNRMHNAEDRLSMLEKAVFGSAEQAG